MLQHIALQLHHIVIIIINLATHISVTYGHLYI